MLSLNNIHLTWEQVVAFVSGVLVPSPWSKVLTVTRYFLKGRFLMDSQKVAALALALKPLLIFIYAFASDIFKTGTPAEHKASVIADVKAAVQGFATSFGLPGWVIGFILTDALLGKLYDSVYAELGTLEHLAQSEVLNLIGQAPPAPPA